LSYYTGVITRPATRPFRTCLLRDSTQWRRGLLRLAVFGAVLALASSVMASVQDHRPPTAPQAPPATRGEQATEAPPAFPAGVLWQVVLPAAPAHAPAFDSTHAYIDLRDGTLVALSTDTGQQRWMVTQTSSVAMVAGHDVLAGVSDRVLWVREAATGVLRWEHALDAPAVTSVGLSGDALLVGTENDRMVCVSLRDGSTRWQQDLGARPTTAPLSTATLTMIGTKDGRVAALSPATGAVLWQRQLIGTMLSLSSWDDRVAAGSDDNFLYVLESKTGELKWRWRTGGDLVGTVASDAHHIYYVSMDNTLRAHNRDNGHLAWQRTLSSRPVGSPVPIGDRLVVAGVAPELRGFTIKDGSAAGVVTLAGRGIHTPQIALASGEIPARIVVVSGGGRAQAIGQTLEPALVPFGNLPGIALGSEASKR
jgi:outer membrane protein assembly factor BamB